MVPRVKSAHRWRIHFLCLDNHHLQLSALKMIPGRCGSGDGANGSGDGTNGSGDGTNGSGDGTNGNGDGANGNGDGILCTLQMVTLQMI